MVELRHQRRGHGAPQLRQHREVVVGHRAGVGVRLGRLQIPRQVPLERGLRGGAGADVVEVASALALRKAEP